MPQIKAKRQIRLLHLIGSLERGGAEMMLLKLLGSLDRERFAPAVITLIPHNDASLTSQFRQLGIPLYSLGLAQGSYRPTALIRLVSFLRQLQPDLIQSWMYHANLAASLTSWAAPGRPPVIWNIRHSLHHLAAEKKLTALVILAGRWLSRQPRSIIYNAQVSARQHEALGYAAQKSVIIPNGFDCDSFRPRPEARPQLRQALNLPADSLLIGLVARYHPMKDHATFIRAAGRLAAACPQVYFILAGRTVTWDNPELAQICQQAGLTTERCLLLGEYIDIPALTAGLDIATLSSSYGEGFPNVIGEAMACGVPCVVTEVGDAAWIVTDTGRVVPPRNPAAMAAAWAELINLGKKGRAQLGQAARQRVLDHFSLPEIVRQYEALYYQIHTEVN